jgi:hypothetical protein
MRLLEGLDVGEAVGIAFAGLLAGLGHKPLADDAGNERMVVERIGREGRLWRSGRSVGSWLSWRRLGLQQLLDIGKRFLFLVLDGAFEAGNLQKFENFLDIDGVQHGKSLLDVGREVFEHRKERIPLVGERHREIIVRFGVPTLLFELGHVDNVGFGAVSALSGGFDRSRAVFCP